MPFTRVIVIFKKNIYSPFEQNQHFNRLHENNPALYDFLEKAQHDHSHSYQLLVDILHDLSLPYKIHTRKENRMPALKKSDLVISLGGDGTFIYASHYVKDSFTLGVNSAPETSVGFYCKYSLTDQSKENFRTALQAILNGQIKPAPLQRLQFCINGQPLPKPAINDALITGKNPVVTSRYVLQVNDQEEDQKSSGLWISTATGSTAAYHSAGGSPFDQFAPSGKRQFGFIVREQYNRKENSLSNLILTEDDSIHVISGMKHGRVYIDGSFHFYPFTIGDKLTVRFYEHPLLTFM